MEEYTPDDGAFHFTRPDPIEMWVELPQHLRVTPASRGGIIKFCSKIGPDTREVQYRVLEVPPEGNTIKLAELSGHLLEDERVSYPQPLSVTTERCAPCSKGEHGGCQGHRQACACTCGEASDGGRLG